MIKGISWTGTGLRLDALTATVLRLSTKEEADNPVLPNRPEYHTPVSPSPEKVLPPQTAKTAPQLLAQKKEETEVQALVPHPDSASVEHGEETVLLARFLQQEKPAPTLLVWLDFFS